MKRNKLWVLGILGSAMLIYTCKVSQNSVKRDSTGRILVNPHPSPAYLSPEESLKSIHVPNGYHVELVASEPMVREPVAIAWDGNGRMYVAELNTYMQDINGTGQTNPTCQVKRLEDTDGDGKMDKATVFIDSLVLPRMLLCIGNELLVNETFTYDVWAYKDTNGDGKSDAKREVFKSDKKDTRNLEHQNSGLIWNQDNWIYVARDAVRYKYVNGKFVADGLTSAPGQWGLTSDNYGRLYFSNAGGEVPAEGFQVNPAYGRLEFRDHFDEDFQAVWPIIATPDVQGGMKRLRPDTTLNHFTSSNGQSIFRGDRLPADLQGDLLICEPVGRLIRRAKVTDKDGKIYLKNAYDKQEFLASTDMNFRPVNTATGPDGCLYIVDMNHGIIQEKEFVNSFLGPRIKRLGLDKNVGNGRIYRLVHDGFKRGPKPTLLDEPSSKLVTYLDHPNGWWRDNAQKELIVRGDKSVIPALEEIALGGDQFLKKKPGQLARIQALWTLEGLNAIKKDILFKEMKDADPQIRKTAVWISEQYIRKNDADVIAKLAELQGDQSYDVLDQLELSLGYSNSEQAKSIVKTILSSKPDNEMLAAISKTLEVREGTKRFGSKLGSLSAADRAVVLNGATIYRQLCSTCHGPDGKGLLIGGSTMPAPPFVGSKRIAGNKENIVRVLLNGLSGPVDGKTYEAMPAFGASNNDEWVAAVASYIRHEFGNTRPNVTMVDAGTVKSLRASSKRSQPWTIQELESIK